MATLQLRIDGAPGTISVRTFLTAVDTTVRILTDLDPTLSGLPRGSLDWLVGDLENGSLVIELESRPRRDTGQQNVGAQVARVLVEGLEQIEREASTPPYFSDVALDRTLKLVRIIGQDGATGLVVSDALGKAQLSLQAAQNLEPLVIPRRSSIGSVEGKLGLVSVYKKPRFRVYEVVTHRAVTCEFDEQKWLQRVKDALGRRVLVSGIIQSNIKGEPLRVQLEDLRVFPERSKLPQIDDVGGRDPELTGSLSTAEYIARVRSG